MWFNSLRYAANDVFEHRVDRLMPFSSALAKIMDDLASYRAKVEYFNGAEIRFCVPQPLNGGYDRDTYSGTEEELGVLMLGVTMLRLIRKELREGYVSQYERTGQPEWKLKSGFYVRAREIRIGEHIFSWQLARFVVWLIYGFWPTEPMLADQISLDNTVAIASLAAELQQDPLELIAELV